jgi:hypothetical protein
MDPPGLFVKSNVAISIPELVNCNCSTPPEVEKLELIPAALKSLRSIVPLPPKSLRDPMRVDGGRKG